MTIEEVFLTKMSSTNIDNIENMDFVLNLDILNGCVHSCDGCYINKVHKVSNWEEVVESAYNVAFDLSKKGLRFRELILGPTDFFSASNTVEVIENNMFQKLLTLHEKTRITAACIFDNMDKIEFKRIFSILDNPNKFKSEMILEFLIPLNSQKVLARDQDYINSNRWAIDFFANSSPKIIDWSYVVNIHTNESLKDNYIEVVNFIKNEFNTILEFNPGFFRSNNNKLIDKNLSYWKGFLQDILSRNDKKNMCLTNLDFHHNTGNTICLNFHKGEIYFSPFIYEQIVDVHDSFRVNDISASGIIQQHIKLQVESYNYAEKTEECSDCNFLPSCAGRNVLNFMKNKSISHCLFPDKFRDLEYSPKSTSVG